jgi:glycosyltransferase involved in cell wall biosynthesis
VLLSESQAIDKPRVWWKEAIKARRVRRFSSALVGGPTHRDYLIALGMPAERIATGYNAVDNHGIAERAEYARRERPAHLPARPYFLAVNRFVPEKNLDVLVRAYERYRASTEEATAWELVLCGDGPVRRDLDSLVESLRLDPHVHRPGFLQERELIPWYAHAGAFVHPSRMEPWGLVVNEAAACGLPLLVSDRCGCAETLVPDPPGTSGYRFDPGNEMELASMLSRVAGSTPQQRRSLGERAREIVSSWGPERFAEGMLAAIRLAGFRPGRAQGRGVCA